MFPQSARFTMKGIDATPGPNSYDLKNGLLNEDQTKHFGFLEKSQRFREHSIEEPLRDDQSENIAPKLAQKLTSKTSKSYISAEIQLQKEFDRFKANVQKDDVNLRKSIMLMEDKIAKLESALSIQHKEKIVHSTLSLQKDKEISDLRRKEDKLILNLEKSEKVSQSCQEKLTKSSNVHKKIEELEKMNLKAKSSMNSLSNENQSLAENLKESHLLISSLKGDLETSQIEFTKSSEALYLENSKLKADLVACRSDLKDCQRESNQHAVKQAMEISAMISEHQKEDITMSLQISQLSDSNESSQLQLREKVDLLDKSYSSIETKNAKILELQTALLKQLDDTSSAIAINLKKISEQDVYSEKLSELLLEERSVIDTLRESVSNLQNDLGTSITQCATLRSLNESLERTKHVLIETHTEQFDSTSSKFSKQISDLEGSLMHLRTHNNDLQKKILKNDKLNVVHTQEIERIREFITGFSQTCSDRQIQIAESMESSLCDAMGKIERFESRILDIGSSHVSKFGRLSDELRNSDACVEDLKLLIISQEVLINEKMECVNDLSLKSKDTAGTLSTLTARYRALEEELSVARLQSALVSESADSTIINLRENVLVLESISIESSDNIHRLMIESETLRQANLELTESQTSLSSDLADTKAQLAVHITRANELQSEINKLEINFGNLADAKTAADGVVSSLEATSKVMVTRMEITDLAVENLAKTLSVLEAEKIQLVERTSQQSETIVGLSAEAKSSSDENSDLRSENQSVKTALDSVTLSYNNDQFTKNNLIVNLEETLSSTINASNEKFSTFANQMQLKTADLELKVEFHSNLNEEYLRTVDSLKNDIESLEITAAKHEELGVSRILTLSVERDSMILKTQEALESFAVQSALKEQRISELESSVKAETGLLNKLSLEFEDCKEELGNIQGIYETLVSSSQSLTVNLELSQTQNAKLADELETKGNKVSALEEAFEKQSVELTGTGAKLSAMELLSENSQKELEGYILTSNAQISKLNEHLQSESDRASSESSLAVKNHELVVSNLKSHHGDAICEMQTLIDRLQIAVSETNDENYNLHESIEAFERSIKEVNKSHGTKILDFESEISSLNSHIKQLTSAIAEYESSVSDLTVKAEESDSLLVLTRKNLNEFQVANKEITLSFNASRDEINKLLASMDEEREASKASTVRLQSVNQSLTETNDVSSQKFKKSVELHQSEKMSLALEIDRLKQISITLKNDAAQSNIKIDSLTSEMLALETELEEKLQTAINLVDSERTGHREQISTMHSRLVNLTVEAKTYQDLSKRLELEKAKQDSFIRMLEMKHTTQVGAKNSQLKSLEEQLQHQTDLFSSRKDEFEKLQYIKHEKNQLAHDLDLIKGENAVLDRKIHDMQNNEAHDRRTVKSQLESKVAEISILKQERERVKKEMADFAKKKDRQLQEALHEVRLAKAKEDFVTGELLKASEEQSGQVGHNNAKQKIKLFSQLKEENVKMKKELEADKMFKDDCRRKISGLEREVDSLKSLTSTGKPMSKAQRAFRELSNADDGDKEN